MHSARSCGVRSRAWRSCYDDLEKSRRFPLLLISQQLLFVSHWANIPSSHVFWSGISYASTTRRRPNCFTLFFQLKFIKVMNREDVCSFEARQEWSDLLSSSLTILTFNGQINYRSFDNYKLPSLGGLAEGLWCSACLQHWTIRVSCSTKSLQRDWRSCVRSTWPACQETQREDLSFLHE